MYRAVLFDFYGTLGEAHSFGPRVVDVLRDHGYTAPDELIWQFFNDGLDGTEHDEHSRSRDHYVAWQRARFHDLLTECGVADHHRDPITSTVTGGGGGASMVAYDDAHAVAAGLRDRGVDVAICSNWDWDLMEAVEPTGLHDHVDVIVSSAWVGARKPHRRMYDTTLARLSEATGRSYAPDEVLFVGDTWNCDVEGPRAFGMAAAYVRRAHRERDHTAPDDLTAHVDGARVHRFPTLEGILGLL